MNYKVLAVGVALGFMMAVAPSCSPEPACGPSNCNGCCTADGVCTETASQTAAACGASGNACVACVGNATCSAGVCTTPNTGTDGGTDAGDGGGGGGCNATTCPNGCCSASGVCRPGTSSTNCGQGGQMCGACGSGETCTPSSTGGTCQPIPDAGMASIGQPCTNASECTNLPNLVNPANALCLMQSSEGNFFYKDGFCTRRCINDSDCGQDGFCLIGLGRYGENNNICLPRCSQTSPCREGYDCLNFGSQQMPEPRCLPQLPDGGIIEPLPAETPANPGVMGGPCSDNATCQPPTSGECIPETLPDGGLTGYPAGMCSADCTTGGDDVCGTGGVCVGYISIPPGTPMSEQNETAQVVWFCEGACSAPGTTTGCRTNYTCDSLGGSNGHCIPRCDAPGNGCPQGQTCNMTNGQCM